MYQKIFRNIHYLFILVGIQGLVSAFYISNFTFLFGIFVFLFQIILSISIIFIGFRSKRYVHFYISNEKNKILQVAFWIAILIFVSMVELYAQSNETFDLFIYFSIGISRELIIFPLLAFSCIVIEFSVIVHFSSQYNKGKTSDYFDQNTLKRIARQAFLILVSLALFLSRNLWRPASGDTYRAARQISSYVMQTGIIFIAINLFSTINRRKLSSLWFNLIENAKMAMKSLWAKILLIVFAVVLFVIFLIRFTGIGITYDPYFWNGAGVPVLYEVVVFFAAALFLVFFFKSENKVESLSHWQTLGVIVGIYLVTSIFWVNVELPHTYFAPKLESPNYTLYPFSDAQYFDVGAQYALLGQGVNNMGVTDRPILMVLFSVFHLIAGQEYSDVIFIQILFLAFIPVLLFILGRRFESPIFGIALASISLISGAVRIAMADTISLSNAKVFMSELPSAWLLILTTVLIFICWRNQNRSQVILYAFAAGGIVSLAAMVRTNNLVLIFALSVFSIIIFAIRNQWRIWFQSNLAMWLAVILVFLPYSIQTYQITGRPFFLEKIMNVIDRSYAQESWDTISHAKTALIYFDADEQNFITDTFQGGIVFQVSNHFAHNIIMSFMSLPTIPGVVPMNQLIEQSYWDASQDWFTQLKWYQWGMIGINLVILSAGLSAAFTKWKWVGFTPLMIFLSYHASNALARTSGGRYLVPVNWVMCFYYFYGVYVIIRFLANGTLPEPALEYDFSQNEKMMKLPRVSLSALFIVFGLLGASPVLVNLIPNQLPVYSNVEVLELLDQIEINDLEDSEYLISEVSTFINSGAGKVISGVNLYPRFYHTGDSDEQSNYVPTMPVTHDRVYFIILSAERQYHVNLLQDQRAFVNFPNAEQMVVIGCDYGEYFDAFFVLDIETESIIAIRSPLAELSCIP